MQNTSSILPELHGLYCLQLVLYKLKPRLFSFKPGGGLLHGEQVRDARLFKEGQNTSIIRSDLVNTMRVIRENKATA